MKFYCSFPGSISISTFYVSKEERQEELIIAPFNGTALRYFGFLKKKESAIHDEAYNAAPNKIVEVSQGWKAYESCLKKAIEDCISGEFKKIVVSRCIQLKGKINCALLFKELVNEHPNAFVYWFEDKDYVLIGATPEVLLTQTQDEIGTSSLAGTMLAPSGGLLSNWGNKERTEQRLVTEYILSSLKPFCNTIEEGNLEIKSNGKLNHLHTSIRGQLKSVNCIESVLFKLHPTPAVCGIPREKSRTWILEHEGYSREYYAGFLGVKSNLKSNFFVNLRCVQMRADDISVYVGGGITADSDFEKEKVETINKSRIILDAIEKTHQLDYDK